MYFALVTSCFVAFIVSSEARGLVSDVCPDIFHSVYVQCTRNPLVEGTECRLTCSPGYKLHGAEKTTCRNRAWSAALGTCEAIYCPRLTKVPGVAVYPPRCYEKASRVYDLCQFSCPVGYRAKESMHVVCNMNGQWTGGVPTCIDIEPPVFNECPYNTLRVNTDPGKATASLTLPKLQYSDNSQAVNPNAKLTLKINKPSRFTIGRHRVVYIVRDEVGLINRCEIPVVVVDKEPPVIITCPSDITKEADTSGSPTRVVWDVPLVKDNSGEDPVVMCNRRNGGLFNHGQIMVEYRVVDGSGNEATCHFRVTVKRKCVDHSDSFPPFSCTIPASDLKKCGETPFPNFPLAWKELCPKTCHAC